ncbi:CU044_5270 family protein [Nocardioides sp. URHA0020]|uniref:CU044_5270 family protein n=1 Tax=Nocardioides sp. URHA0020 TaxID=1380392 RepID=UPI0006849FFD|nr:CU044_5270 family protein [Nocardioides sp. URHA0020]
MTETTDLRTLRAAHPAPRTIELSPAHRARLEQRVLSTIAVHDRRRRRMATVGTVVLVAGCLVAVLALALAGRTGPRPPATTARAVVAAPAAVTVLHQASVAALAAPAPEVSADQFVYVRSEVISNEGRFGEGVELGRPHEREIWLGQDPGPAASDKSVIREFGQDWPITYGGPAPAGLHRPTYTWLAALPTDPDRLLDLLEQQVVVADRQDRDQAVFNQIGDLVRESVLPPATAAALYEAVARIPGVRIDPAATDAMGRGGVGVTRADAAYGTSSTWIFDRHTHELLGTREFLRGAGGQQVLFNATAVLERAVVDGLGETTDSAA